MQNDPFRIRDHVADFDSIVADIVSRSAAARERLPMIGEVAYGSGPSETVDIFFPDARSHSMPVHLFIHGGYWRMFSKRDYSCVAETATSAGAIAVILDYALMPAVRMEVIVDQVRRANAWLLAHIAEHGGDPTRLTVSGHSAGAHLSTFLFQSGEGKSPQGALLLGGLYDLKPLQESFLKTEIGITDDEVAAFTPMEHTYDSQTNVTVLVGENETPPFHQQARDFASVLQGQGLQLRHGLVPDRNHMDSVRDLGIPGTDAANELAALIRQS